MDFECRVNVVYISVPGKPINVSFREVTDKSVYLSWGQPEQPNGIIQGYRLYFMHKNFTDVRTIRNPIPEMEYPLKDLSEYPSNTVFNLLQSFCPGNKPSPAGSGDI